MAPSPESSAPSVLAWSLLLAAAALVPAPGASAQSPPATDIWILSLQEREAGLRVSEPRRATDREGYDNQPHFLPGGAGLLYTSIDDTGQADIHRMDLETGETRPLTRTAPESEYSPTLMAGGNRFSTVRVEADSTQRLWWFELETGRPGAPLLENVAPVGYHAWADDQTLVLFVLGDPATLRVANVASGQVRIVAEDIGRTILPVPGRPAVTFLHYVEGEGWITELDPSTDERRRLARTFPENEYYAWTPGSRLLTARGSVLYHLGPGTEQGWEVVADLAPHGIGGITRLAVSPEGDRLAVVAER